MKTLFRLFLAFVVFGFYASSQIPEWALTHKHAQYPTEGYIIGIGSATGDKADEASRRLAQSDIATQIRTRVQSEIKNMQATFELNKNEETFSEFRIRSTTIVNEQIPGATIVETKTDASTNTVYALAVLNKLQFVGTVAAELDGQWNEVERLHQTATNLLQNGKIIAFVQNLVDARRITIEILPKQALHDAVSRISYPAKKLSGPLALTSEIRNGLSILRLEKISGDGQKGKIGNPFPDPFIVRASVKGESGNILIEGLAVLFKDADGNRLGETVTEKNGEGRFMPVVRGGSAKTIQAIPSLGSSGKEFEENLPKVIFSYQTEESDVQFAIQLINSSGKAAQLVKTSLINTIGAIGYRIVEKSRFVVVVEFITTPAATIPGFGGPVYSVGIECQFSLEDQQSKTMLGALSTKGKGVGKSETEALEKAASNVVWNQKDILSILEKAKL